MSNRFVAALLIAGWLVAGCSGSSSDGIGPTNPQSGNGAPPAPPPGVGDFVPLFRPTSGVLPFPIDLYFSGTTDGTLNLPVSVRNFTPHFDALNALDGFSTTADITLRFSGAIDEATLAANVRVVQVAIDNATKATVGVLGIPAAGRGLFDRRVAGHRQRWRDPPDPPVATARGIHRRDQQRLPGPHHGRRHGARPATPPRPMRST